ncbi:MAG TPA: HlyD family secretion protein [Aliidongia sp.]|nr:HlyD family secretion protein [Aliidongia sp.]
MSQAALDERQAAPRAIKARRTIPRGLLALGLALAIAIGGATYILAARGSVSTDDAYTHADSTTVAPKIRGLVAEILVRDNQLVKAGDPLVRIDPEEFDARVDAAEADLQNAEASVGLAQAALVSLDAEEDLARSNIAAAETQIRAADAQNIRAAADHHRFDTLVGSGAGTQRDADLYRAAAVTAQSDADHSRAMLAVNRNQAAVIAAKRPSLIAQLGQAKAAVARAKAALDLARQDQAHMLIAAPIAGTVGNRQVQPGDYVQPGTRLLSLVPLDAVYVTANFKETQTDRMQVGQPSTVELDALPGMALKGAVESFAPGSGSEFSLLPFEPGTGNFTKIVQRMPVRIRLDAGQPGLDRLRPGLSVTATVRLDRQNAAPPE